MINIEVAEEKAQRFLDLAKTIASVIKEVNDDARNGWSYTTADRYLESITFDGDEVIHALRGLAMQLDRAALLKNQKDD